MCNSSSAGIVSGSLDSNLHTNEVQKMWNNREEIPNFLLACNLTCVLHARKVVIEFESLIFFYLMGTLEKVQTISFHIFAAIFLREKWLFSSPIACTI